MSTATAHDAFVFDLSGDNEGGFYRVVMTNRPGELNRRVMVDRGGKFQVTANLLAVAHNITEDGGIGDETLLIATFSFVPSREKRFVGATITWTFTSDDPAIEVSAEKTAPAGTWSLNPIKQSQENHFLGTASISPGAGPVTGTVGGEYGIKRTTDVHFHTKVNGVLRNLTRNTGGHDTVRWTLEENKADKTGICRILQVGVRLKRKIIEGQTPKPGPPTLFRGELEVVVDKASWSEIASKAKRVWKKTEKDDAIVFQPGVDLKSSTFDIVKSNLDALDLETDVMFMSLHESFEDVRKERAERMKSKREEGEQKKKREEVKQQAAAATVDGNIVTAITSRPPPIWVYYVAAGVAGMYLWQQLMKFVFGSGN